MRNAVTEWIRARILVRLAVRRRQSRPACFRVRRVSLLALRDVTEAHL
jgi:hypothetical protein